MRVAGVSLKLGGLFHCQLLSPPAARDSGRREDQAFPGGGALTWGSQDPRTLRPAVVLKGAGLGVRSPRFPVPALRGFGLGS